MGYDLSKFNEVRLNSEIIELYKEVEQITKFIIKMKDYLIRKNKETLFIKNINGKILKIKEGTNEKKEKYETSEDGLPLDGKIKDNEYIIFLVHGVESFIIESIINRMQNRENSILIFDGFITQDKVENINEIINEIQDDLEIKHGLNIKIKLSCKELNFDLESLSVPVPQII